MALIQSTMFRSISISSKGSKSRRRVQEGDSKEEAMKDPADLWPRVRLPTDELDELMWGGNGVPPAAPPAHESPKFQKDWAKSNGDAATAGENADSDKIQGDAEKDIGEAENDNILAALEISVKDQKPPPIPDKILLEDIVWKQRSGFGKYSFGLLQHEWEQRRVVLFESGILRYYSLPGNLEGVKYDPSHATDPDKSPWVYDSDQEPRGEMDLKFRPENVVDSSNGGGISPTSTSFGEGMRRLGSLVHSNSNSENDGPFVGGATVQAQTRKSDPGPTPFEIDVTRKDDNVTWRFCFQSQSIQIEWLSMLKQMAFDGDGDGTEDTISASAASDGLANHGFQPGDHIIRWEMLPVLYPIQIHGIVLEAGSNCVIIADFGLASYDNHRASKDLTTWDEGKDDSHDVIMQAWEKIKPKEKKRLNVIAVTDPKEIRKWSKINYGDQVEKDKKKKKKSTGEFFKSLIPGTSKHKNDKIDEDTTESDDDDDDIEESKSKDEQCAEGESADIQEAMSTDLDENYVQQSTSEVGDEQPAELDKVEGEPEWAQPGYKPRKKTGSSSAVKLTNDGQSVFSIDHHDNDHAKSELPKSDSAKLVLARTHFILEHEDLLPPYHVFYSNSECIAVWCKTGRWSTLQAAVYLVSSSVGFGKSATMLTLSIAAAHMILVPALAVGGLAVVGAPLLFLKKSQEKWDKATMHLTEKFWMQAEPEVFVEAIEYWANWGKP